MPARAASTKPSKSNGKKGEDELHALTTRLRSDEWAQLQALIKKESYAQQQYISANQYLRQLVRTEFKRSKLRVAEG